MPHLLSRSHPPRHRRAATSPPAARLTLGLLAAAVMLAGCSGSPDDPSPSSTGGAGQKSAATRKKPGSESASGETRSGDPLLIQAPEIKTVRCNVYTYRDAGTPEGGFYVLVDGELARALNGQPATTPCEVRLPEGEHTLAVVKKGFRDLAQEVLVQDGRDFELTPEYAAFADPEGFFASRFSLAKVGEEFPLTSLNTGGKVYDPFLAADAKTLWFAGQRGEGKGIYVARRGSPLDEFSPPELVTASRGADPVASPSLTSDGKLLVFTALGKARIWQVLEDDERGTRQVLKFSDKDGEVWPSTHITADGLTLFSVQQRGEKTSTYSITRKTTDDGFDRKWSATPLPGVHPVISHDGLRHYQFDGQLLRRAVRARPTDPFSTPEPMLELTLRSYIHRPDFRQFWVSHDEQWMIFTDDPQRSGNLFAVRLFDGPNWGFVPRGRSIPPKLIAAADPADTPEPGPAEMPEKPATPQPPAVDPRTLPLPYAAFRQKLDPLLAAWNFAAAADALTAAQSDPALAANKELLAWDAEELDQMRAFWTDLETAIANLKPGDRVRVGAVTMTFEKRDGDRLVGKSGSKVVDKPLTEIPPADLIALVDKTADKTNEAVQMRMAAFLAAAPAKTSAASLATRLQKAGVLGRTFSERQQQRKIHLIEQEVDRGNMGIALEAIEQLVAAAPKSETATRALRVRDSLYTRQTWRDVGGQTWDTSTSGEYKTTGKRSENAFLVSDREFANFELSLEWKTEGSVAQGGAYFRFPGRNALRGNSYKIHVANDFPLRAQPDRFSTGALFGIRGPETNAVRAEGEWNTLRVRVEADRVQVSVNGVKVLENPLTDANIPASGYVCLDGEFPGITYRKVLVYELPAKSTR